jgi:branched-chain amino acid transport system substrate-binding protein
LAKYFPKPARLAATAAAVAMIVAACGSSTKSTTSPKTAATTGTGSSVAASTLPASIHIYSIQDSSGAAGAVGVDDQQGADLAIQDINKSHFLGSTTLSISYADSATSPTTAANLATQAAASHYPLVIGPPSSSTAIAVAPILARASQPTIFTQAGGPGTIVNQYIYRMTPLQTDRYPKALAWLKSKGVKTIAAIQDSNFPTEVDLTDLLKAQAASYGLTVVGVVSVLAAQSNISAEMSKLLSYHADALAVNVVLTQNATAATLAQQGGFNGPIIAEDGAGNGSLNGAGAAGNGIVWSSDWVPGAPNGPLSDTFTTEYKAAYGNKAPSDWAAESYDAVWFAARAFKQAGSIDPAKVQAALASVGTSGFTGVLGSIKVANGQENSTPILVQWQNGAAVPMANQNP